MSYILFILLMGPMSALHIYSPKVVVDGYCVAKPGSYQALYCPRYALFSRNTNFAHKLLYINEVVNVEARQYGP